MNALSKKTNVKNVIFTLVLFSIILRKYMISFVDPSINIGLIKSILFYGSIATLGILFLLDSKKSITEILLVAGCSILYIINREGAILLIVLLAVAAKNIDDKYIVKNYLIISVIFLTISILIFNLFPWLEYNHEVHYRYIDALNISVPRLDYGLGNPNAVFYHMVTIYTAYIFLRFEKYNNWDRLLLFGTSILIYQNTYSRTGFYTVVAGLVFVEIIRFLDIKKIKPLSYLAKVSPILLTVVSVIIGTVFYKNSALNRLLASRPKYWNVYLSQEGNFLNPFGNAYSSVIKSNNPLDNSYVYIVCMLGLVAFALFAYIMYMGIKSFIEKDKKKYLSIIVIFLIYCFAENLLLEAAFSFGIILVIKEIMLNDKREINIYEIFKRKS